jgi:ornithine decarboxylase
MHRGRPGSQGLRRGPSDRIEEYLRREDPVTPCVIIDLDIVRDRYEELDAALPDAQLFYAVKANPTPDVLELLADLGSSFDVASRNELERCHALGIDAERISFGNTVKKAADVAAAHELGVRRFAFDSAEELDKISEHAPGSVAFCRILCDGSGADYPLSRKFGCSPELALPLLGAAASRGHEVGLSFHVGSQQRLPEAWDRAFAQVADVFARLRADDIEPALINIGGGFPGNYDDGVPPVVEYGECITAALRRRIGPELPRWVMAEPGRGLVADAGLVRTEVVLVTRKDPFDEHRWVYLDVGTFGGLIEAVGEAIRYPLRTTVDVNGGEEVGPVVLAGPTCDSMDVLYEHTKYELPLSLAVGDRIDLLAAGAYTATLSTVGFNGFDPLVVHHLEATDRAAA